MVKNQLSLESTERLRTFQARFDQDPTNFQICHSYFRELNRNGLYQNVIRLYQKNQDYYQSIDKELSTKLRHQYEYAIDHLDQYSFIQQTLENNEQSNTQHNTSFQSYFTRKQNCPKPFQRNSFILSGERSCWAA